ncbi:MAG: hypothetical protein H0X07_08495 [Gemmatimonadales bacterium]|nr:hypothetical protein [Gemmatimonadales bacterium]
MSVGPEGVKVVPKGGRRGHGISWTALLSGEVELRRDLNMSLDMYDGLRRTN